MNNGAEFPTALFPFPLPTFDLLSFSTCWLGCAYCCLMLHFRLTLHNLLKQFFIEAVERKQPDSQESQETPAPPELPRSTTIPASSTTETLTPEELELIKQHSAATREFSPTKKPRIYPRMGRISFSASSHRCWALRLGFWTPTRTTSFTSGQSRFSCPQHHHTRCSPLLTKLRPFTDFQSVETPTLEIQEAQCSSTTKPLSCPIIGSCLKLANNFLKHHPRVVLHPDSNWYNGLQNQHHRGQDLQQISPTSRTASRGFTKNNRLEPQILLWTSQSTFWIYLLHEQPHYRHRLQHSQTWIPNREPKNTVLYLCQAEQTRLGIPSEEIQSQSWTRLHHQWSTCQTAFRNILPEEDKGTRGQLQSDINTLQIWPTKDSPSSSLLAQVSYILDLRFPRRYVCVIFAICQKIQDIQSNCDSNMDTANQLIPGTFQSSQRQNYNLQILLWQSLWHFQHQGSIINFPIFHPLHGHVSDPCQPPFSTASASFGKNTESKGRGTASSKGSQSNKGKQSQGKPKGSYSDRSPDQTFSGRRYDDKSDSGPLGSTYRSGKADPDLPLSTARTPPTTSHQIQNWHWTKISIPVFGYWCPGILQDGTPCPLCQNYTILLWMDKDPPLWPLPPPAWNCRRRLLCLLLQGRYKISPHEVWPAWLQLLQLWRLATILRSLLPPRLQDWWLVTTSTSSQTTIQTPWLPERSTRLHQLRLPYQWETPYWPPLCMSMGLRKYRQIHQVQLEDHRRQLADLLQG